MSYAHAPARRAVLFFLLIATFAFGLAAGAAQAKPKHHGPKGKIVNVMTRNLYLGADLTPALAAPNLGAFVAANGQILREVTANDFPVRAKGLAKEILAQKPDLVGLQEVALWRTAAPDIAPVLSGSPAATTIRYDYLQLLLDALNKGKKRYRAVVVQPEFDFEAPADENGLAGDGPNFLIPNAEINGRLTMRDVILARVGAGVTTKNPLAGHFSNLLVEKVAGVPVTVTRGWTEVDARVRGSHSFRFVNTHLEAFDDRTQHPTVSALQAQELAALGGPLSVKGRPVVLVGDLNSDDDTVVPDDRQAYQALVGAGMRERSAGKPLGCCLNASVISTTGGGSVADFDHQVDHVMTRTPKRVKLVRSSVTGRQPVNGFWDSDHAGLFSSLTLLR